MKNDMLVILYDYELEDNPELAHLIDIYDCAFTYIPEDNLYYISFYNENDYDDFKQKCVELLIGDKE